MTRAAARRTCAFTLLWLGTACAIEEKGGSECVGLTAERKLREQADKEPVDCHSDADCGLFYIDLDCVSGCPLPVRKEAIERLRAQSARLEREYCDGANCVVQATCARGDAVCVEKRCEFVAMTRPAP